jgi:hypothetical protein
MSETNWFASDSLPRRCHDGTRIMAGDEMPQDWQNRETKMRKARGLVIETLGQLLPYKDRNPNLMTRFGPLSPFFWRTRLPFFSLSKSFFESLPL